MKQHFYQTQLKFPFDYKYQLLMKLFIKDIIIKKYQ